MSFLIRQKLLAAIDRLEMRTSPSAKTFIVYLPTGESQELSLLFLSYLLQSRGHKVIYLGQNITINDLKDTFNKNQSDFYYTFISG